MGLDLTTAPVLTIVCNNNCVFYYLRPQWGMFGLDKRVLVYADMTHLK